MKMELFALLRMHLEMCGVEISQNPPKSHPFNVKNSTVITFIFLYIALSFASLNEDTTFDECTDILLRISSYIISGMVYVIIVWKTSELVKFINNLADIISESE